MKDGMKKFFGDEGCWRNPTERTTDESSVNRVDIYHAEEVGGTDNYTAYVKHCRKFPSGKGFMGSASGIGSSATTRFTAGTSQEVYDKVRAEAMALAQKMQDELDAEMAKIRNEERKRQEASK